MGEAYLPTSNGVPFATGGLLAVLVVAGFLLQRARSSSAWLLFLVGVVGTERLTTDQPDGFRMLALCGAMLYGMKAVVGAASCQAGSPPLDVRRWFVFSVLWPGMRPSAFATLGGAGRPGVGALLGRGLRNAGLGAGLLVAARWTDSRVGALLLGLPGLSLLVHFGLFHALAALWRALGAEVSAPFRDPPRSRTLAEFWSRRWNLAFSEMTSLAVHRPLRAHLDAPRATVVAFLYSGLLHELAISLPVRAGWGGPSAYFALHGLALLAERRLAWKGTRSRVWTIAWVLLPTPLLFHGPFLRGVVEPLLR